MSKELEAWKRIKEFDSGGEFVGLYDFHEKEIEIIDKALTPPTADEVCKALSDYLGRKVTYNASSRSFNDLVDGRWVRISTLTIMGRIIIIVYLPPRLVIMIGKFYESLEEKENE